MLSVTKFRKKQTFARTLYFMLALQVFTEMLHSQFMAWGFVRVEQLYCVVAILGILVVQCRQRGRGYWPLLGFAGIVAGLVLLEFEMDKAWITGWLWDMGTDWA